MLKKLKARLYYSSGGILILSLMFLIFGRYYYDKQVQVKANPPIIEFSEDYKEVVSVTYTDEDFLQYVTATDIEDGDLSNSVIVEQMSNLIEGNRREIVYAVCDSDNNVTKINKIIKYSDYEPPVIEAIDEEPTISERKYVQVLACFQATDVIDGDISNNIKIVSIDTSGSTKSRGVFPVVLSVSNSCGDVSYLETSVTYVEDEEVG